MVHEMSRRKRRIGKSALTEKQRKYLFGIKFKQISKAKNRSEAGEKGGDTRTRKEGMNQVTSGVIELSHPIISTTLSVKDIGMGTAKIILPRKIRKSKTAKLMDII